MTRATAVLAVVLTPFLWPFGVLLLWLSPIWNRQEKLIGTMVLPGGLALATLLELGDRSSCLVAPPGQPAIGVACVIGPTYALLHPGAPGFNHVFGALVFSAAVLLPLSSAAYLALGLMNRWSLHRVEDG